MENLINDDLIESVNEARLIIENLDESGAMTIGFEDNQMYKLSGIDLQKIAKALYLADCLISDVNENQL